ncbi:MAG: TonB-dependent receptor [Candidatus Neomarinimicrobiota bacterium]|nr:TonB-dependent receptor [Candidatus Neomarinimicrobiota bacterium]
MARRLIILLSFLPLAAAARNYTISGSVIDTQGEAVSEVHVTLTPGFFTLYTDSSGAFRFGNLSPGSYNATFQHIGFLPSVHQVTLSEEDLSIPALILEYDVVDLEDVVVTASRAERDVVDVPESVSLVSSREIRERNSKTSAEALREEPGVFVQKTNHGGGSAIIRGLSSNQILLLVDGIRLNNSVYRLGNHQYLTTVDNQMIERMEVVRGPTSVLYGSDALGGTINLITRKPRRGDGNNTFDLRSFLRYATVDQEKTVRGEVSSGNDRFVLSSAFSLKQFGDLRRGKQGNDEGISGHKLVQSPTGFDAFNLDAKLLAKLGDEQNVTVAHQSSSQLDVPRYDKYHYSGYKRWDYHPQKRALSYAVYENTGISGLFDMLKANVSFHTQQEGRESQKTESSSIQKELDNVSTQGFGVSGVKDLGHHRLVTGGELYRDRVSSERHFLNPKSGEKDHDPRGRYPDDASYRSVGLYLQDEMRVTDRLLMKMGFRYSSYSTEFDLTTADGIVSPFSQTFASGTSAVGTVFKLSRFIFLNLNVAQAFRAPNLSDMAKLGQSKGDVYEVPNNDLKPEQLLNTDLGLKISSPTLRLNATVYRSAITDILTSDDATYTGTDAVVIDGEVFKVKTKRNLGKAVIQGVEFSVDYSPVGALIFRANLTSTRGQNTTLDEPVGGIPPLFGLTGIRWSLGRIFLDGFARFAARQERLSSDDLDDPRIPDNGTPGWFTLNARGGITLGRNFILQISLENLLDRNYREHGSGMNGPGRNFILSLQVTK